MKETLYNSGLIAFSTTFILALLQPFGIDHMSSGRLTLIGSIAFAAFGTSLAILTLMNMVEHKRELTLGRLLVFHLINTLLLSAVILSIVSMFNWSGNQLAWYCTEGHFSIVNYLTVVVQVVLISLFIAVVQIYRISNSNLRHEIDTVRRLNAQLEERQARMADESDRRATPERITLEGNANNAVITLTPADIIYIESMANYANIWLNECNAIRCHTLRITMRQLREQLSSYEQLFSCHRAFMVNLDFIVSIGGRPSSGYQLRMFGTDKEVPVSRNYTEEFDERVKQGH